MANRGLWTPVWAAVAASTGADTVAHELGHALGLVHSARQGEAYGAFRWSRGYYVRWAEGRNRPQGTIMTYGQRNEFGDRFSNSQQVLPRRTLRRARRTHSTAPMPQRA